MDKSIMPKVKHDHKWTDKLKVIIFALLMLAPLFSVLVKCLYTLNPNAKDSYYGETINEHEPRYMHEDNFIFEKTYYFNSKNYKPEDLEGKTFGTSPNRLYLQNTVVINTNITNISLEDTKQIAFWKMGSYNYTYVYLYDGEGTELINFPTNGDYYLNIQFDFVNSTLNTNVLTYTEMFYEIIYNKDSYLDNVFYYAVDQIKEDNLFKWVENTIVYNGLNAMNTGFGLTSNHVLTYLLAYWTILTAIYIVIDIILFLFTKLTHFLQ